MRNAMLIGTSELHDPALPVSPSSRAKQYALRADSRAIIPAPAQAVFDLLDDHRRLSSHMAARSWRMGGGKMDTSLDEGGGRRVGSHIVLRGSAFGMRLFVDETIVRRVPPTLKAWEVVGEPRLVVIGPYRMGFAVIPDPDVAWSHLAVWIDYDLPRTGFARVLGRLFGKWYARWCTRRMVDDARRELALKIETST